MSHVDSDFMQKCQKISIMIDAWCIILQIHVDVLT